MSENSFKSLMSKAKTKKKVPIQSEKNGIIKPIEKTFLHSLEENKLISLKKLAIEKRTNVRALINKAINEKYFKNE